MFDRRWLTRVILHRAALRALELDRLGFVAWPLIELPIMVAVWIGVGGQCGTIPVMRPMTWYCAMSSENGRDVQETTFHLRRASVQRWISIINEHNVLADFWIRTVTFECLPKIQEGSFSIADLITLSTFAHDEWSVWAEAILRTIPERRIAIALGKG
jgi:hypothetical protein